ncbi:MAG: 16S rRNA (guanine(527)-N(7))-methyltransferase RsmG [Desulfosarcina sp.]
MKFEIYNRYFPNLSEVQLEQFRQLGPLYCDWNAKINVISRQDIDNLYERHVLHSLAIAKVISFKPETRVLDAGTGGGFPGIPLAIMFPEVHFHLVDSTAKKLKVVRDIADRTGLKNITTEHCRLENHHEQYDFVVSRAVASIENILNWTWKNIRREGFNDLPNGILYLKGMEAWGKSGRGEEGKRGRGEEGHGGRGEEGKGEKGEEGKGGRGEQFGNRTVRQEIYELKGLFSELFFNTKVLVHLF